MSHTSSIFRSSIEVSTGLGEVKENNRKYRSTQSLNIDSEMNGITMRQLCTIDIYLRQCDYKIAMLVSTRMIIQYYTPSTAN